MDPEKPQRDLVDKTVTSADMPISSRKKRVKDPLGDALPSRRIRKMQKRKPRAKTPRKRMVSQKVRALIGALIENPDQTLQTAGVKAGYPAKNAAKQASAALKSASAQELFRREMSRHESLRHPGLAEKLAQGLDATVTKFFAHEGQVIDERECVDYGARHSYLSLAARLAGIDPTNKVDITTNGKDIAASAPPQIIALKDLTTEQLIALLGVVEPGDVAATPPPVEQVAPAHEPDASSSMPEVKDDSNEGDGE